MMRGHGSHESCYSLYNSACNLQGDNANIFP